MHDACMVPYLGNGESKQDMKRRGIPSPDLADAVVLCFSEADGSGFIRNANFRRDLRERYAGGYV